MCNYKILITLPSTQYAAIVDGNAVLSSNPEEANIFAADCESDILGSSYEWLNRNASVLGINMNEIFDAQAWNYELVG
jgi:hypothetical protein